MERRLKARISEVLAIDCVIALAPLHTLPRTSSGKLSQSEARRNYMDMSGWGNVESTSRPELSKHRQNSDCDGTVARMKGSTVAWR